MTGRDPRLPFPDSLDPDRPPTPRSSARRRSRRLPYPSDLNDAEWELARRIVDIEPDERPRRRRAELREIVNAIRYRWRTGCPWRMLPHDFPRWTTVYGHFMVWKERGTLAELRDTLAARPRYHV